MNILIKTNAPWIKDRLPLIKEFFAPSVDLTFDVEMFEGSVPLEDYQYINGIMRHGIKRSFLSASSHDITFYAVTRASTGSPYNFGYQQGNIVQVCADEHDVFSPTDSNNRVGNVFNRYALHELSHALFFLKGIPDTTHQWDYQNKLENILADLKDKVLYIIHHSATPMYGTNLDAIRADHKKRYGRSFYQCFITPDGETHWEHKELNTRTGARSVDYCIVGNFLTDVPTKKALNALNNLIDGREVLGHGEATVYGATASECPGKLLEYYREWKKGIVDIQSGIDFVRRRVEALIRIFYR